MNTDFGELVRRARERRGLKAYELARLIGRHPSYVSDLETGKRSEAPPPDVVAELARELGLAPARMLAAWGYDLGPVDGPAVADPRLRRIAERLAALDRRHALQEADLRHLERVLAMAEAVADGRIVDEGGVWVVEHNGLARTGD